MSGLIFTVHCILFTDIHLCTGLPPIHDILLFLNSHKQYNHNVWGDPSGGLHGIRCLHIQLAGGIVHQAQDVLGADDVRCEPLLLPLHFHVPHPAGQLRSFPHLHVHLPIFLLGYSHSLGESGSVIFNRGESVRLGNTEPLQHLGSKTKQYLQ